MSEQDRYIAGVPCWVDTAPPDPRAALAFYGELFGWQFEDIMPAESPVPYFVGRLGGGDVAAVTAQRPDAPPQPAVWNTYIWVDDADETAAKVRVAGGSVLVEPVDAGDQGRVAVCADRSGAAFKLWQAAAHRGAAIVNEHGALNFNGLNTGDVEDAKAFYGTVFGWELLGEGPGAMWALPGYGEFLERRTPGTLERMASMGAPERFEDVVAALNPLTDDVPAHWSVVFGVDDADAIAARATELGGEVLVAPFDAPWVRTTVLRDPQGATFTATQFVPENQGAGQSAGASAAA